MDGEIEKGEREEVESFLPLFLLDTRRGTNSLQIKTGDAGSMQQHQSCAASKNRNVMTSAVPIREMAFRNYSVKNVSVLHMYQDCFSPEKD
jgi:hypothetical protein